MDGDQVRDVATLTVPRIGRVDETGDAALPYRLPGVDGAEVGCVNEFLRDMVGSDASAASLRSYCYEPLAWFRFLWVLGVPLDRAAHEPRLAGPPVPVPDLGSRRAVHRRVRCRTGRCRHHRVQDPSGSVRTVRAEITDRMLITGERHLRRILDGYARHYNGRRPHRSLRLQPPRCDRPVIDRTLERVKRRPVLGGLINEYEHAA
jgi:hypothetical protein